MHTIVDILKYDRKATYTATNYYSLYTVYYDRCGCYQWYTWNCPTYFDATSRYTLKLHLWRLTIYGFYDHYYSIIVPWPHSLTWCWWPVSRRNLKFSSYKQWKNNEWFLWCNWFTCSSSWKSWIWFWPRYFATLLCFQRKRSTSSKFEIIARWIIIPT